MENQTCCHISEINIPDQMPDFNSPGNIGSWRQAFAANIGRFVRLEIAVVVSGPLRSVCGTIYSVGNQYVGLVCDGKIVLADILGIKFAYFD